VDAAAAQITKDHGRLDGLVNNAGIAKGGPLEYLPLATWREQFEVNALGQVAVTKAMLPLIRAARGRIVFMGSTSGKIATMMFGPYCASKFALEAISESLRHELHPGASTSRSSNRERSRPRSGRRAARTVMTSSGTCPRRREPTMHVTRYVVGADAMAQNALVRWLTGKPRETIIRRIAGP
jgi:NAD(P)-dependent dehydrogenase (short-subunit alcohol dehydrogenase family)